jgi:hypothetical protein
MSAQDLLRQKRDSKAMPHLEQYAPAWLVDEKVLLADEAVLFEVVFQHNLYGWVRRRYRYDGFNDVLYYRGQTVLSESETLTIQEKQPYITTGVPDVPNAYGG